nr:hypothetical protein BCU03_09540 [Vibrio breoganii]
MVLEVDLKVEIIKREEGYRRKPYYCSEGYPTIGYGLKIGRRHDVLESYTFTMPPAIAEYWLKCHIEELEKIMANHSWYRGLNESRQAIIISMAYQLGIGGLFKFKRMIAAIKNNDFEKVKIEALDSKWAKNDTPLRSRRHADVLATGDASIHYS